MNLKKFLQDRFIDFLTRNLLKGITLDDVFQIKHTDHGKVLYYRGKVIEPKHQMKLAEDARKFKDSAIWKIISNRVRWEAYQRMFHKSKDNDDMRANKLALHTIQLIEKLFKRVSEL